jgi:hypothetical protein
MSDEGPVVVTSGQMYALLLSIDARLSSVASKVDGGAETIRDHEARIREIETREDLSRRVTEIETTMKVIQQRLWALPSIAGLAAIVALVIAISDRL